MLIVLLACGQQTSSSIDEDTQPIMTALSNVRAATRTTAMLVISSRSGPVLCPFFSKCDGVLLLDQTGSPTGSIGR